MSDLPSTPNPQNSSGPTAETRRKRTAAMQLFTFIFVLFILIWFFYWLVWGRFEVYTDDAYVNGNIVQLMSQIPGTVTEINVDDTQLVKAGQVIIKFDPADMELAFHQAEAGLAQSVRQVRQLFSTMQQAQAELILRKADLERTLVDLRRRTSLVGISAVSKEELLRYQTSEKSAAEQYNAAFYNLHSLQAMIENTDVYNHPTVERAKANFRKAYLNYQRTMVVAPVTGYVAKRSVQVGQRVLANTPMMAIIPLNETWVDANYKESQINHLRIGQPVLLYADAYPNIKFHGKIFGLNAGTGAAFSLLPPQNATGNWIKIVQRLPVRISLDPNELKTRPLQLGLSMRATTDTKNLSGHALAQIAENKPLYTTSVYKQQSAQADQLIDKILKDNSPNIAYKDIVR